MIRSIAPTPTGCRTAVTCGTLAFATILGLTACQAPGLTARQTPPTSSTASRASASTTATVAEASVRISPKNGSRSVRPDQPVVVAASGGRLTSVTVTDDGGRKVSGDFEQDGARWRSTGALRPDTSYRVTAVAANSQGRRATRTSTLTTLTPRDTATYSVLPSGSGEVGVGMPVVVQFDGPVDQDKRAAVERKVSVRTTPEVEGAWGWLDARQLVWRPRTYWRPGTKVFVTAGIAGLETRSGVWTARNAETRFSIGSAMVSTVDVARHTITVRRNGRVLRTMPVTNGKAGFRTRNGVKVILSRETERQMDAETTGLSTTDPEYYNVKVRYAMRLTWSGEFVHAAPWSVGSQGRANVSHGCTGMSTADAQWLFERSKLGDVVRYVGSDRSLEPYNGYTMWNMSLDHWRQQSALA